MSSVRWRKWRELDLISRIKELEDRVDSQRHELDHVHTICSELRSSKQDLEFRLSMERREVEHLNHISNQQRVMISELNATLQAEQTAAPGGTVAYDSPKIALTRRLFDEFRGNLEVATGALAPGGHGLRHERTLGAGTYGIVTLESSPDSGKGYAVKRPIGDVGGESLRREMMMMMRVPSHPNIVKVVSAWDTGSTTDVALALELASGDLHGALYDSRHSIGDIMEMMVDVCSGISHMHNHDIIHSDLKFQNILVHEVAHKRFIAKVTDFGFAQVIGQWKSSGLGTTGFLAPENRYEPVLAHPSQDVYSLGAMLIMLMVKPDLFMYNIFAHPMLWTARERAVMDMMSDETKEEFLIDISFRKVRDTTESGFSKILLKPENLRDLPRPVQRRACRTLASMVHPDPNQRPTMETVTTFVKVLAHATRWVDESGRRR